MDSTSRWFQYLFKERNLSVQVIQQAKLAVLDHKLAIPVFDKDGNRLFTKYRKPPTDTTDAPKYTYEKGASVSLYGINFKRQSKGLYICEGELDVLALRTAGFDAVSSTGGALSWQSNWEVDYNPILLFDNDETGIKGAVKTAMLLSYCTFSWIPPKFGKDASDVLKDYGAETLQNLLNDPTRKIQIDLTGIEKKTQLADKRRLIQTMARDAEISVGKNFLQALGQKLHELEKVYKPGRRKKTEYDNSNQLLKAKSFPINRLLRFNHDKKCHCPFHNEKTPSLHFNEEKNNAYCFGGCNRYYDSVDVYMLLTKCTFKEAIKRLGEMV